MLANKSVKELKESFVYNASLGSKELFHSNIWAWILEKDFGYMFFNSIFKRKITKNDSIKVKREEKNRDLTIYINNNEVYIIENKLKSIPYKEQLLKYQQDININEALLTGIGKEPLWLNDDDMSIWRYKNYNEIAKSIKEFTKKLNDTNDKKYLIEYANSIEKLSLILEEYYESLNDHLPLIEMNNEYITALKELRVWDLAQKYVANEFVDKLTNNDEFKKIKSEINGLKTEVGFHNGKFTIDCRIEKGQKRDYKCIGIQIEGDQYRRLYQLNTSKRKGEKNKEIFEKGAELKWFTKEIKNKTINFDNIDRKTNITKDYCSYSAIVNDDKGYFYSFVYQYWNLNKDNSSFEELIKCIIVDLTMAKKLINLI